jgi:type III secretion protein S
MTEKQIADVVGMVHQALGAAARASIGPLLIGALVGLVVGFLQAATSIQDNTTATVLKIACVGLFLFFGFSLVSGPVLDLARICFAKIGTVGNA